MPFETVFKRYEIKYLITREQKDKLLRLSGDKLKPDKYGRTEICSLYYDTDNYRLIRRSEEKPVYKEKLRVRSYGAAEENSAVFVELKKKYDSVVYKRRAALTEREAALWLAGEPTDRGRTQIEAEIDYFRRLYSPISPKMYISCEREAFVGTQDKELRITFDENILARADRLTLTEKPYGIPLLSAGQVLLEIKTPFAIPLWLSSFLTAERIFRTSFSKYGTAYNMIILNGKGELRYVC